MNDDRYPTDVDLAKYVAEQSKKMLDSFVGASMTNIAFRSIKAVLTGLLRDVTMFAGLGFDFAKEIAVDIQVEGNSLKVTWVPATDRAEDVLRALQNASPPGEPLRLPRIYDADGCALPNARHPSK
jgi:hypothetical protein